MIKVIAIVLLFTTCYAAEPRALVSTSSASIILTEYDAWGCYAKDVVSEVQIPMDVCYPVPNKNSTQQTSLFITNAKKLLPADSLSLLICTSATSDCAMPFVCQKYLTPGICMLPFQGKDSILIQQTYPLNTLAPSWSWKYGPGTSYTNAGFYIHPMNLVWFVCLATLFIGM
uniref:Transmembrane protein n=1 Tax=Clandestinovirus TaxID=2831644 RepID=A0A8F8KLM6_9VIRU|nr:transmembrane protein [Clandestinovirus]